MARICLLLLVLLTPKWCAQAMPFIAIGFSQKPIHGKLVSLWVKPAWKTDEVEVVVMFRGHLGEIPLSYGDVEVTAANADGTKLPVLFKEEGKSTYEWASDAWEQGEYRLFVKTGEKSPSITVRWRGEQAVFPLSEGKGMSLDGLLMLRSPREPIH